MVLVCGVLAMVRRVVVFDIDGTLADNTHRQHHLMGEKKDWKSYNKNMIEDGLYEDIADLLITLNKADDTIILCTGREEVYKSDTIDWLIKHDLHYKIAAIYMRKEKDYRSDAIVKVELLKQIEFDYDTPWLWLDDRQQVVDAIRAKGIRVLQVQPGDF